MNTCKAPPHYWEATCQSNPLDIFSHILTLDHHSQVSADLPLDPWKPPHLVTCADHGITADAVDLKSSARLPRSQPGMPGPNEILLPALLSKPKCFGDPIFVGLITVQQKDLNRPTSDEELEKVI